MKTAAIILAALLGTAASAEVTFTGYTDGSFTGTPTANAAAGTVTFGGLSFADASFSGTTSNNFLGYGNFGTFTLSNMAMNYNTPFSLLVTFTAPAGTAPTSSIYTSLVQGSVSTVDGGVFIDFDNTAKTFTYAGGSFTLAINDLSVDSGTSNRVSGTFRNTPAVPEAATWAMMVAGFGVVGASMRRRRTTSAVRFG